jgi:hypothetical protein
MLNNNKKNKKNSNKEIENIIKVNDYIKKKVFTINKNKGKIAIKKNIKENELNNKKKTNNNNMIRIRVQKKNITPKNIEHSNNNDEISNIKRIILNQNEIENINKKNNKFKKNNNNHNQDILIIQNISQSIAEMENKKAIRNENEKEAKKKRNSCSIKLKNNPKFRQRSSSYKFKKYEKKKEKKNSDLIQRSPIKAIKVKLPNSEGRRKKYKINIVKRIKIKFKQHFNFSEEKILINNYNNEMNEVNEKLKKRNKTITKKNKEKEKDIEKDNKIISIIKEDLENYILFSLKNENNKIKYNFSIIGQLLAKQKINLCNFIQFYLTICYENLDDKNKLIIANEYIQNIIEKYKRSYLTKDNFIKIHEDILDILVDICTNDKSRNIQEENKYKYDIIGSLFYSLLINEMFFVSDLNIFLDSEEYIYINAAKVVRYIIIYSNDEKLKNKYYEEFRNCKIFFNNPIYFKYVTRYLKS